MSEVLDEVLKLLNSVTGLDSTTVGGDLVERGIRRRMEALHVDDAMAYRGLVRRSRDELQHLINEVTVPETWFYRDYQPFVLLEQYVETWRAENPTSAVLRILSIPCSSGEEAYSIAMTLLDSGLSTQQFCVDGVDINTIMLARARRGLYGRNSFRGDHLEFRDHFFRESPDGYDAIPRLQSAVSFIHGNILDRGFMSARAPYDVIFCRNLLIYFNAAHKKQALTSLSRLLKPAGLLFLGHAETGQFVDSEFESVRSAGTFAYRKRVLGDFRTKKARPAYKATTVVKGEPKRYRSPADAEKTKTLAFQTPIGQPSSVLKKTVQITHPLNYKADLAEIESLADRGDLGRALDLCQQFIDDFPTASEAYYLMGVIKLAQHDEPEAVNFFRKALYLNSNYYQALIQLSVLADKEGNTRAASNYRMRAERLKPEGDGV